MMYKLTAVDENQTMNDLDKNSIDDELLRQAVVSLNFKVLGLVLGFLFGMLIFIATNWLLIKGGAPSENGPSPVGPHLELLGQFFIGYRVSFLGSIIGFLYGFALGSVTGAVLSVIYNKLIQLRDRNRKKTTYS